MNVGDFISELFDEIESVFNEIFFVVRNSNENSTIRVNDEL